MNLFISQAYATETHAVNNSSYSFFVMLIMFGFIFYFTIFRPQQQRIKKHNLLLSCLKEETEVLTNSGIIGKITKIVDENYIKISINLKNDIVIQKNFIMKILPKGTFNQTYNS